MPAPHTHRVKPVGSQVGKTPKGQVYAGEGSRLQDQHKGQEWRGLPPHLASAASSGLSLARTGGRPPEDGREEPPGTAASLKAAAVPASQVSVRGGVPRAGGHICRAWLLPLPTWPAKAAAPLRTVGAAAVPSTPHRSGTGWGCKGTDSCVSCPCSPSPVRSRLGGRGGRDGGMTNPSCPSFSQGMGGS